MDTPGVIQLVILVVLLILSAFFSSAETALTTLSNVKVRAMADENPSKRVLKLQKILDNRSKLISAILIGNNVVNISASSLMTSLVIRLWGNAAVGIGTGVLTLLVLIFGEIVPKTWAMCNNEKLSLAYANTIYLLMQILTPVIFIIDKISGLFLNFLHIDSSSRVMMTETELKTYVDVSHEDGVIEQEEKKLIYNVFEFGDSVAKDIMIPRIDMTTIDVNASYEELLSLFRESMYSRIPVYENEIDNIIGIVIVKDFLLVENREHFKIRDILREGYYTYEYKKTADLLLEMRLLTTNVALILNEYGATVGMITVEDLLEEIVGEIRDEYDADEAELLKKIADNTYEVGGSLKLDDINDVQNVEVASEGKQYIVVHLGSEQYGGIMIELLDRFPTEGESVVTVDGITLTAKKVDNNRIETVVISLPESGSTLDNGIYESNPNESEVTVQSN